MQTTEDILAALTSDVVGVTSKMLADLIKSHRAGEGKHRKMLWDRYTLKNVPIMHHKVADFIKVNEKLAHDFYADIVDTKTGYMGNEVTVSLNREEYKTDGMLNDVEYDKDRKFLRNYHINTSSVDLNSEMVGLSSATGVGYRLLYVPSGKNDVFSMNLEPWEVIYIFDDSLNEAVAALRFYIIESKEFGDTVTSKEITVAEWYDRQNITYYIDDGDMNFRLNTGKGTEYTEEGVSKRLGSQPHLFDGVPIIPFINNGLLTAEPEKVLSLIDGFDVIMSATVSEVEQFRLAYMFAKGSGLFIDNEFMKGLEQTGVFPLPENGEIGFVEKHLALEGVKIILDEIRKNIYEFSKSIDMSKDYGGDMRVIGWQIALLNLENSCIITERKFIKALREEYRILSAYWKKFHGVSLDSMNLDFTFTRNFPRDIHAEAETLQLLLAAVSTETAYSQMSFIADPETEIKKKDMEDNPFREIDDITGVTSANGEDIQKKAFNGAQVTALKDIVQAVSAGELTREAAIDLILVAFPDIGEEVARKMITSAGSIKINAD